MRIQDPVAVHNLIAAAETAPANSFTAAAQDVVIHLVQICGSSQTYQYALLDVPLGWRPCACTDPVHIFGSALVVWRSHINFFLS